jgi:hypothetical protein
LNASPHACPSSSIHCALGYLSPKSFGDSFCCLNSVKASRRAVLPTPTFFTSFDSHQQLPALQTTQRQRNAAWTHELL